MTKEKDSAAAAQSTYKRSMATMDAIKSALEQIKKDRLVFPTDAAGLLFGLLVFSVAIFALHRAFLIDPDTYWHIATGKWMDLREYSISNSFVLLLAGLFFLHALLSGRWVTLHENVAFALLMFAILLLCYSKGWLGGGDVKLLTVAMLWVGFACALPFSVFLLVFAALHTVAVKLKWVEGKQIEGRRKIAFAPSINAALIGSFVSGCLASPDGHFCM